ncbi:protein ZBED8-like [Schistocerca gregaria]|uniref:protein ZBED8-like n=1 Tax=Schistocerca gregaria TaxID=7010 RepID=UPI00211EA2AD|nr:protein ZBED8-like [Schistocerca gregaria]
MSKLISVCTDGCLSMMGINSGLITLIKMEWNLPNLLSIHCLRHQEILAYQISKTKLKNIKQTVISVINFIRARELNHQKFKELLQELQAFDSDVLLHTTVRWRSKGKVLERVVNLKLFYSYNKVAKIVLNLMMMNGGYLQLF